MTDNTPIKSSDLAIFCKATADILRLDILRVLNQESFGVLELCQVFDVPQPGMSHHLKVLSKAGLVATRKEGTSVFYRRSIIQHDQPLTELTRSLFSTIDHLPLSAEIAERVAQVHFIREAHSRQFFEKNARRIRESQELIANYEDYADCLVEFITADSFAANSKVLEIGPGESPLMTELTHRFRHVTALDTSEEMLKETKQKLGAKARRVKFITGDLADQPAEFTGFTLLVLNMVLHHLASPAQFFQDAYHRLAPGGALLIADLCSHQQDWAREACGDLWLGFEPTELDKWSADAGLRDDQSTYLGLKNGFQIQLRLFTRPE